MSTEPLVRMHQLSKSFDGGAPVLDKLDLSVRHGEFVSLIGPSGCGKSTLLKLVAGLLQPSGGQLDFAPEVDISNELSFVFQEPTLLPWCTVKTNVELPLSIRGVEAAERASVAMGLLDKVGLGHVATSYPRQLSGGMKMRASIARALTVQPRLLLLDEPFGALDEMTRDSLNEELLRMRQDQEWGALFVTHSVSEAVFLSSRIVVLAANPGRIAQVLDVPLTYPRTPETRATVEFSNLVRDATRALHSVRLPEPAQAQQTNSAQNGAES